MDGRPAVAARLPGDKPAGTVSFAIAGPRPTKSMTKLFAGDRERVRRAAAYFALDLARRYFT
jgi:nicotinamide-nucleotide amidase